MKYQPDGPDVKSILNTFEFDITLGNVDIYHFKKNDLLT